MATEPSVARAQGASRASSASRSASRCSRAERRPASVAQRGRQVELVVPPRVEGRRSAKVRVEPPRPRRPRSPRRRSSSSIRPGPANANMPGSPGSGGGAEPAGDQLGAASMRHPRVLARAPPRPRGRRRPAGAQDPAGLAQRRRRVGEQHVAPAAQHAVDARPSAGRSTRRPSRWNSTLRDAELRARGTGGLDHRLGAVGADERARPGATSSAARKPVSPGPAASSSTRWPGCGSTRRPATCETGCSRGLEHGALAPPSRRRPAPSGRRLSRRKVSGSCASHDPAPIHDLS